MTGCLWWQPATAGFAKGLLGLPRMAISCILYRPALMSLRGSAIAPVHLASGPWASTVVAGGGLRRDAEAASPTPAERWPTPGGNGHAMGTALTTGSASGMPTTTSMRGGFATRWMCRLVHDVDDPPTSDAPPATAQFPFG